MRATSWYILWFLYSYISVVSSVISILVPTHLNGRVNFDVQIKPGLPFFTMNSLIAPTHFFADIFLNIMQRLFLS